MKLSTIHRLIKEAESTSSPAGDFDEFMSSIEQLEKHAKHRRVMEPNYSKQDLLSDIHRELPDIDTEMADKMTDFVFKHIDTDVTEASIDVDMQSAPTAEELDVGETVKIVGDVNYQGKVGHIDSFGRDKQFVIVDLGNDGLRSFHSSDVGYYVEDDNDEAEDGDIEEDAVEETKHGLYYNVNKRKKAGTSRDASSPEAPTAQAWKDAAKTAKNEGVAEGGMPSSIIRVKEKILQMTDAEKKEYFKGKTSDQLQQMSRRHGYGETSNVYTKYATPSVAEDISTTDTNPADVIMVDVPLFIRLMEYAREDAKTDMDLHTVTEKLTAMSANGRALSMADYDAIISTDTVEETVNEVSPHNYNSDVDYYYALRKPRRQEPDDDTGYDDDYNDRLRSKPVAARLKQDLNNEEGTAPNGKKYNNIVTFSDGAAAANKAAADSFADYHWGAKDVVYAKQNGDSYVLYVVDNHKYGMWKPWKEATVGEAAGQKEKSAFQRGYEAGLSRRPESNPYADGTKENKEFSDGEQMGRADRNSHYESTIAKGTVLNEYTAFKKGRK